MPKIASTLKAQTLEVVCVGEVFIDQAGMPSRATVQFFTKDGQGLAVTNISREALQRLQQQRSPFADLLEIPPRQETASARQGQSQDAGVHSVYSHSLSMNKP